jgi:hypothetical protein
MIFFGSDLTQQVSFANMSAASGAVDHVVKIPRAAIDFAAAVWLGSEK